MLSQLKHRLRSVPGDARAIRALIADPVLSRSYYPDLPRKSKTRILSELIWWWMRFAEVNRYYYLYGLDRTDADWDSVMPYGVFRAMRNGRNLHPAGLSAYYGTSYNFVCMLRDKFLFSTMASSFGFPVPKVWAVCSADSVFWPETGERTGLDGLTSDPSRRIDGICKPVDGIMGTGIFAVKIDGGRIFIDGAAASVDDLAARLPQRHLLQARLTQQPGLAKLHPQSINTLRLVTFNRNRVGRSGDRPAAG